MKWRKLYGKAFNDADTLKAERDAARKERDAAMDDYEQENRWRHEVVEQKRRVEAERDELQARLDAADGRTETIRIYEDLFSDLGIDTDQPQEAIFAELRRKISALVVAADPSVMENR